MLQTEGKSDILCTDRVRTPSPKRFPDRVRDTLPETVVRGYPGLRTCSGTPSRVLFLRLCDRPGLVFLFVSIGTYFLVRVDVGRDIGRLVLVRFSAGSVKRPVGSLSVGRTLQSVNTD